MNLTTLATRRSIIVLFALAACLWMCTGMAWAQGTATFQGIGIPGDTSSVATDVSGDGLVVVGFARGSTPNVFDEAFRWTASGGRVPLGDLPGGFVNSEANAA